MKGKLKLRLTIGVLMITISFSLILLRTQGDDAKELKNYNNLEAEFILVDVSGEVVSPEVLEVKRGTRVFEAINLAGGLKESAYIELVNLAEEVKDEQKLVVPKKIGENNQGLVKLFEGEYGEEFIYVNVFGEVNNIGVVKVDKSKRVKDVIEVLGGLKDEGDLSKINMAESLIDGMNIYVPKVATEEELNGLININTATLDQLKELNGIGDILGQAIIDYRKEHGIFRNIENLKNVSGIGDKKFENVRNNIRVY